MKKLSCILYLLLFGSFLLAEDTVYQIRPSADTFVLNPEPGNIYHTEAAIYNYGGSGSRSVASPTAYAYLEDGDYVIINDEPKGEFISLLKFDFSEFAGSKVDKLVLDLYISNGNQSAFGIYNYIGSAGEFDLSLVSSDWYQGTGAPHEMPSNSLNGISYVQLQEMLNNDPAQLIDVFYYTAENSYGYPQWFSYTLDLSSSHHADLLNAIGKGETVTFMLSPSKNSNVSFNFCTYVQLADDGGRLRPEGPILHATTNENSNDAFPQITNCYTDAAVSGQSFTGGLVGYNASIVEFCYSAGSIEADISDPGCTIGGLFGQSCCDTQNCYWNRETSGILELDNEASLTTDEMMNQTSFVDWDFSLDDGDPAEWMMLRSGQDYPRLAWQEIIAGDIAGMYGVDQTDLAVIANCWLAVPTGECAEADVSGDASVNLRDFAILSEEWLRGI